MGLGIAQSVMGYQGAQQQYRAQQEFQRQNAINAANAASNDYDNLNIRSMQEDTAAHQQQQETAIEAAMAAGTVETAAAEGGVGGMAVGALLGDIYAQRGRHDAALGTNQRMNRDFITGQKTAVKAGAVSQINSVPLPEKPGFAPYLMNAFSTGLSAYSDYKKQKQQQGY